jgi:succinate-semialdehyde dehydrogenase/glutarate-semialdehyde dehydrogenase
MSPPLRSVNPATGETIREYPQPDDRAVAALLDGARRAFDEWRTTGFRERASLMRRAGARLRERQRDDAVLMAVEMGKPVAQGRVEIDKCASACDWFAENAERLLAPEDVDTEASHSFVTFAPLGVILAVMPWNFPFWQVVRFASPAFMAGNSGLLKHAGNVSGCALAVEAVFREAGFPDGLFRAALVDTSRVAGLVAAPEVRAVTLTGSTGAGRAVAARAGEALKKTVLELGGSDPYLVLEDADLEAAAETCVASRLINSGQSCIAAKRFIVVEKVLPRFEELFVARMKARRMGDPLDEATEIGPLARHDLRDDLHRQVTQSVERGARVLLGGTVPPGKGAYYPPTVLTGVRKGMPAFDEELFGPVAAIVGVPHEAAAVRAANDSPFGLGAAVFTGDAARGERLAAQSLEAGSCFVNALVKSDPRLPFGGIKESGYGRELSSFGIREFVNVKTVYVK